MRLLFILPILFSLSLGEFLKSENIVIDNKKNLMWQDNIEATNEEDIILGNTYCEELVLNGYIDWKLPNIKQLQSLIDQDGKEHLLNKTFQFFNEGDYYSNTPHVEDSSKHWYVNFKTGEVLFKDKENLASIRCVREILK